MNDAFSTKMKDSIIAKNFYILVAAIVVGIILLFILLVYCLVRYGRKKDRKFEMFFYFVERILNEMFVTGITIFPLLGLYGTVKALLCIDFSNEIANAQANFFDALTSTAWGIIFAVSCKIVNAVLAPCMERLFENEEKHLQGTERLYEGKRK